VVALSVYVHGAASCDTVKGSPAMRSVPERASPLFGAALNVTVPLPVPVAALVMLSHGASAPAVQPHDGPAVTATEPPPPLSGTVCALGAMPKLQTAAACDTVKICPATLIVPLRSAPVFSAAVNATVPPLVPAPTVTVNHGAFAAAVQVHVGPVATLNEPAPPVAGTF
jgi:hypothetical protein